MHFEMRAMPLNVKKHFFALFFEASLCSIPMIFSNWLFWV